MMRLVTNPIMLVATIHFLWGTLILSARNFPRPFGALEPFFGVFGVNLTGIIMLAVGAIPMVFVALKRDVVLASVPQQFFLGWGAMGGAIQLMQDFDLRVAAAMAYVIPITVFHTVAMIDAYVRNEKIISR